MARHRRIGGTDIARIVGASRFGGPMDVYRRIVEGAETPDSPPMRRGRLLEPAIRQWYLEDSGAELEPHPGVIESPRYEFMAASPDDFVKGRKIAEYKSARFSRADAFGEPGTDQVPQDYLCQCLWYLAAADRDSADLAVLLGGDELRVYNIQRDVEAENLLVEAAARFWRDHVKPQRPPPPDASESYAEWLARKFPASSGNLLPASAELAAVVDEVARAKAARAAAEEAETLARNNLLAAIGDADGVQGLCTYRSTKGRAVTNWSAVAEAAGVSKELIEKFTERRGYRVLRLAGNGGDK